jgi:hypothetical protein
MEFKAGGQGGGSNPNIIFLKASESVVGVLRGNPHEFERAFKPGEKARFTFRINIVTKVNGQWDSKIIQGGWKLYRQLKELNESGWNLEECYTKISRQGSSQNDTVYSATPSPQKPDGDTLRLVSQVKLKDLTEGLPGGPVGSSGGDPRGDIPFNDQF